MSAQESSFEIPPFPAFPSVSRYVAIGSLEDARQRVSRSIDAREGLSLVIGPPGTGKSLLCAVLNRDFSDSHDVVNLGDTPIEDAATFYRHLLHHLNVSFDTIPEGDLQLAVIERVRDEKATQKGLLLLIDEAQAMSADVLEAIRMTTNIMLHEQPRVYAVVCGGPKLDDTLALPALEPLTQRVAARCYLHPLNSQETREYISESIRHCGASPEETMTDEAMAAVHHACSGVPRLINQLVTSAIDVAAEADQDTISDEIIDRAWAELQQLPSPMIEEPSLANHSSTVEFGELGDSVSPAFAEPTEFAGSSADAGDTQSAHAVPDNPLLDSGCGGDCRQDGSGCHTEQEACGEVPALTSHASEETFAIQEDMLTFREEEQRQAAEPIVSEAESAPTVPQTAPETVLFGQFDDEEEVELGNGITSAPDAAPNAPVDLEAMLHSEIIGIASDASDASRYDAAVDFVADEAPQPPQGFTHQNSVLWIDEVEKNDSTADDSDIVIHDDSDMLVIEDDVEVRAQDVSARVDVEEQVVSVDFQAMLSRMRHGASKEAS